MNIAALISGGVDSAVVVHLLCKLPDTGERYLSTVLYAFEEYPLPNNH